MQDQSPSLPNVDVDVVTPSSALLKNFVEENKDSSPNLASDITLKDLGAADLTLQDSDRL